MSELMLKRRLNPVLLISIIAALSLLAGVSVISQDQINEKQDTIQQLEEEKTNLNQTIQRLNSEVDNKSVIISNLNQNNSRLKTQRKSLQKKLSKRNNKVDNLSNEIETLNADLENAEAKIPDINVTELNSSLQMICDSANWNESIDEEEEAEEECEKWVY